MTQIPRTPERDRHLLGGLVAVIIGGTLASSGGNSSFADVVQLVVGAALMIVGVYAIVTTVRRSRS